MGIEYGFIGITAFVLGIVAGLGIGRLFCGWHHKNERMDLPPGHPLGLSDDYCGPLGVSKNTIGDEVAKIEHDNCGNCTCDDGESGCCKDE